MEARTDRRLLALGFAAAFLLLGGLWIDKPGIQNDEAMFASVLFDPPHPSVEVRYFGFRFPAMCFPYIGTVKTAIYAVLFRFLEPSASTVRWPALLLGAWSVYLFQRLLNRVADKRTATLATLFLVCDATYLFTARCDWGPVAMQHLCAIGGVYCWVLGRNWQAFLGGICFGIGLWDKLTFLWILAALVAGALAARCLPKGRALVCGAAGFVLGCYPLLVYNYKTGFGSFKAAGASALALQEIPEKFRLLRLSLGGTSLFGSVAMDHGPLGPPLETAQAASVEIAQRTGAWTESWFPWVAALGAVIGWRYRYVALYRFAIAAAAAGFLSMTLYASGGGSPHHQVLLWPLPHVLAALVPWPRVLVGAVVVSQLLVVNQHYANWVRFGGDAAWTDAIYPLTNELRESGARYRILDWGIYDAAHLLTRGKARMEYDVPGPEDDWRLFHYVTHGQQMLPDEWNRLRTGAAGRGLRPTRVREFADTNGRPRFVIYRLEPDNGK